MKTKSLKTGLLLTCLSLCAACAKGQPSPVLTLTQPGCPAVVPCRLPASDVHTNGDLLQQLEHTEAAWAACAAQIDMIHQHNQRHEQTQ